MKAYCISTDRRDYFYLIERDGKLCIVQAERYRNNGEKSLSGAWTCKGFREVFPFTHLGELKSAEQLVKDAGADTDRYCRFKNGRGKYALEDNDHGTTRIWGDRINSIWEVQL